MALWSMLGGILAGAASGQNTAGQAVGDRINSVFGNPGNEQQQQQQQGSAMDPLQQSALEAQLQRDQAQRWQTMQAAGPQQPMIQGGGTGAYQQPQSNLGGYFQQGGPRGMGFGRY